MIMSRIAIAALGLGLLPGHASAQEGSEPVSSAILSTLQSTPAEPAVTPSGDALLTVQPAPTESVQTTQPVVARVIKRAEFASEQASNDVRHIADWAVDSGDNKGLPYLIIDKVNAKLFVFDATGRIRGSAPVLLGLARGDHTAPGIGDKKLSEIRPNERTTPAGRFVAERGMSTRGVDVVWVDYDSGVSLHRVVTSNRQERRLERLATPTAADNRISYGCINVPIKFYNEVVNPTFTASNGIIYLLPEVRAVREVFASYDVEARQQYAGDVQPSSNIRKTSASPQ
jgi:hypothetical protein